MDARTLRETIDDVRHLLRETTTGDELLSRAADVRARLRAALESVQAGTVDTATAAGKFQRSLHEELADAERKIRDNPIGAVTVAAALGLLLGMFLRRR